VVDPIFKSSATNGARASDGLEPIYNSRSYLKSGGGNMHRTLEQVKFRDRMVGPDERHFELNKAALGKPGLSPL
jgi:hypothetical protein